MKTALTTALLAGSMLSATASANLLITGIVDGPLSGGLPKAIEIYVLNDVADLSVYGIANANNGGASGGMPDFLLSGSASAGDFLYVSSDATGFESFFGFAPDFTSGVLNVNGDDVVELYENGALIDAYGQIGVDGTGEAWEYLDGWAYRNDGTLANGGTFDVGDFYYSGINALDGESMNATAATPFPLGSYQVPAPGALALLGAAGLAAGRRRRA